MMKLASYYPVISHTAHTHTHTHTSYTCSYISAVTHPDHNSTLYTQYTLLHMQPLWMQHHVLHLQHMYKFNMLMYKYTSVLT